MDHQAIVDTVCKAAVASLAGEIGALLGQELETSDVQFRLLTKETLFTETIREKSVLTRMSVTGDRDADCFLLTRVSAAVYLGGTLIMLPADIIEEHSKSGNFDGEMEDAFGEVANIIAGVYTQAFVDRYPHSIRFVKKSVEELTPTKIAVDSEEPFPPGTYHLTSCVLKAGDTDLGPIEFIVPAAAFDLQPEAPSEAEEKTAPPEEQAPELSAAQTDTTAGWGAMTDDGVAPPIAEKPPEKPAPANNTAAAKKSFADAKKIADATFKTAIDQLSEEVGALLGQSFKYQDLQFSMISRADFFSQHCTEKSMLTQLKVTGDREGVGFLLVQIPDAIALGGTLIMLPEDVIDEQRKKNEIDAETEDAYGEIANIVAGGLTQTFLDRYPKQLRFVRTESEVLIPTKVDPDSDEPFPEADYYLVSFKIQVEGLDTQHMLLLFPADVFDIVVDQVAVDSAEAPLAAAEGLEAAPAAAGETTAQPVPTAAETAPATSGSAPASGPPLVLVISETPQAAEPFIEILSSSGHQCKAINYQDDVRELFQQNPVQGVFLVMSQVGEKGFAAAIKLQSAGRPLPPLIFAGPEWTRSAVLRAVKYGASDIIIIPASNEEIEEKFSQHIRKAS